MSRLFFNEPSLKAKELDNSIPLDWTLWSDDKGLKEVVEILSTRHIKNPEKLKNRIYKQNLTNALTVILLNVYKLYLADPKAYVGVSLNGNTYKPRPTGEKDEDGKPIKARKNQYTKSRYNPYGLTHIAVNAIVKSLNHGFLTFTKGKYYTFFKRQSRIRCDWELVWMLGEHITEEIFDVMPAKECIILKDRANPELDGLKELIEYLEEDYPHVTELRSNLQAYNTLLWNTYLDVNYEFKPSNLHSPIILGDRFVKRIFNNKSFEQGGRYYGGFWQKLPNKFRRYITINGSLTCEADFSGLHIYLLYAQEGIAPSQVKGSDVYAINGYDVQDLELRHLIKRLFLMSLNSKSKESAFKALRKEIRENPKDFPIRKYNLEKLYEAILLKHQPIAKHLSSGVGIKLQFIDSLIASEVINQATAIGEPILCVHDSFVVRIEFATQLVTIMEQAFIKILMEKRQDLHELLKNEIPKIKGKLFGFFGDAELESLGDVTNYSLSGSVLVPIEEIELQANPINYPSSGSVIVSNKTPSLIAREAKWKDAGYKHYRVSLGA